jgi:hypothetical protein
MVTLDSLCACGRHTGNSYTVARDIADGINAEMISTAALIDSEKIQIRVIYLF